MATAVSAGHYPARVCAGVSTDLVLVFAISLLIEASLIFSGSRLATPLANAVMRSRSFASTIVTRSGGIALGS